MRPEDLINLYHRSVELGERQTRISDADLAGQVFDGEVLNFVEFVGGNMAGCVFRGCDLRGCRFARTTLTGAKFVDCAIRGCDFPEDTTISFVGCSTMAKRSVASPRATGERLASAWPSLFAAATDSHPVILLSIALIVALLSILVMAIKL